MNLHRPIIIGSSILLLLLISNVLLIHYLPRTSDRATSFAKIQKGMSEEEVKVIVGSSPALRKVSDETNKTASAYWNFPDGCKLRVDFDDDEKVKQSHGTCPPSPSFFDRILTWLGL